MDKKGWTVLATLFAAGMAVNSPVAAQQDGEPVSIGTYKVMRSKILQEERTLLVHLPRGYERSTQAYPVVYMLYGDHVTTYFAKAVSAVDRLGSSGRTPNTILVGITNTDRYRDLLPEVRGNPTGIDDFIRFLKDELFPYVDKNYRTKPYRILVGPQAGGNFGLYAMLKNPDLFQAAIIESPFRWRGGRELMLEMARSFFQERKELRRFLYITYREIDELEREGNPYLQQFADLVEQAGCKGFHLRLDFLTDDDFIPPLRLREGLKELFVDYPFPQDLEVGSLDDILGYYGGLSAEYGFQVDAPEHVLAMQSDGLRQRGKTAEMLRVLHYMLEKEPSSGNALWQLGNYHESVGEPEKAVEYYERMIRFMGSDAGMIRGRVDALKKQIEEERSDQN